MLLKKQKKYQRLHLALESLSYPGTGSWKRSTGCPDKIPHNFCGSVQEESEQETLTHMSPRLTGWVFLLCYSTAVRALIAN